MRALTTPLIVIVDDDAEVRGSLLSLMRSAGFDARGYDRAEGFLISDVLDQADCLVTDLHMPGMSGLDLQVALRGQGHALPVILMTAYPDDAVHGRALDGGALAFLSKPVDPEDLLARVEAAVAARPTRQG